MANHLKKDKQVKIIQCLIEGCSVRSTSRMTGSNIRTILDLLLRIGAGCAELHDEYAQDLELDDLQADELWAYVYCKQRRLPEDYKGPYGDQYTFLAIDRKTKFIPSWLVGKRTAENTVTFIQDLADRLADGCKPQLSTDGFVPYINAIEKAFGADVAYGQIIKDYGTVDAGRGRYSPPKVTSTDRYIVAGEPDEDHICTSHAERCNLTIRMAVRRFTRLTNGFSKKLENLVAAVNLHMAYYNYCRPHKTLKGITPAMAASVTDHVWDIEELIDEACPPWVQPKAA